MSKYHDRKKREAKANSWKAVGYLWGFVAVSFSLLWLVGAIGDGPFGGQPDRAAKVDEGPKTLVTQLGQGSSFMCTTERNIMRLEEATSRLDREKFDLVFEQGCQNTESNVAVTFVSGSMSNDTMNVIYQGKSLWAYGDTVGYQTDAHRAVQQAFIDCEYPCQTSAFADLQKANANQ
jgi:hypothetical protein